MKKMLMIMALFVSVMGFSQSQKYYDLKNLYRNYGYYIGAEQYANLKQGGTAYTNVNFTSGSEYVIVAMSDDSDVLDVDIFSYYRDGSLFMQDADNANVAILHFNCTYSNTLKVVIKNYSSLTPGYFSTIRYFIAYR